MTTTYDALVTAAGKLPPLEAKEATDDYLKRLVLAVSGLPIPTYDRLPADAKAWFEGATDALSAGTRLIPPEGFDRDAAREPLPAPPAPRIMRPSGSAYIPATPSPAPPPAPFGPVAGEPVRDSIIKLMIKEPDLTVSELMRRLSDHHIAISLEAASNQRGFAVSCLRLIREAGWRPPHAA